MERFSEVFCFAKKMKKIVNDSGNVVYCDDEISRAWEQYHQR